MLVVVEGAEQIFEVIPASDVQHGYIEGVVPVVVPHFFPEVVEGVAADHVFPDRAVGIDELTDFLNRQPAEDLLPIVGFESVKFCDAATDHIGPPAEIELQATVGIGNLLLPAAGG